eukprot:snap_masked-scaffold_22-processed-gene-1.5-mRNA-1 protein AED:1.00 eAED:1.00 QI:0/-1/0/0/-1/1/1/0/993
MASGFPGERNEPFFAQEDEDACFFIDAGVCLEEQNCSSNTDCDETLDLGCVIDEANPNLVTMCFDTSVARTWIHITQLFVPLICLLLLFHCFLNCFLARRDRKAAKARIRKKKSSYRRRKEYRMDIEQQKDASAIVAAVEAEAFDTVYNEFDENEEGKKGAKEDVIMINPYREQVAVILENSQNIVARVKKSGSIIKLDTQLLSQISLRAVTQHRILCLAYLKKGSLSGLTEIEVKGLRNKIEDITIKLKRAVGVDTDEKLTHLRRKELLEEALELLESGSKVFAKRLERELDMLWTLEDPAFLKFQSKVFQELHPDIDANFNMSTLLLTRSIASTAAFGSSTFLQAVTQNKGLQKLSCSVSNLLPRWFKSFWFFYTLFFTSVIIIFLSFAAKAGNYRDNLELQEASFQGTFLPVPRYYDLAGNNAMNIWIPILYGFMHCALYFLCWIPIPMTRGLLRGISLKFPTSRQTMPFIDDGPFFHKIIGISLLFCLAVGGLIFVVIVGSACVNERNEVSQACLGFDQIPPAFIPEDRAEYFRINPVQNVFMLRRIVWLTWFPIFPMLHWANRVPKNPLVPVFIRKYWYEIWFYLHHFTAHFSLILALIARFEVFYPAILTWAIYYIDKLRELYLNTAKSEIIVRPIFISAEENPDDAVSSTIHLNDDNVPSSMRLLLDVPPNFVVNAGQWIYLKVPEISKTEWHPFSLASASRDNFIELHVGIRGNKTKWKNEGDDVFTAPYAEQTWTFKLYERLRRRIEHMAVVESDFTPDNDGAAEATPLICKVKGPYGSSFTKCFNSHYYGSIVIGAGTGLTAAESVLRELFWRKRQRQRVPKYAWFIWSVAKLDDLLWAWASLQNLLGQAVRDGILKPGKKWTPQSLMLDWLGIYFYVSKANKKEDRDRLTNFINSRGDELDEESMMVSQWMANNRRLFHASLDDPEFHVEKIFAWARLFTNRKAGKHRKLALCFCGPSSLGHTLGEAAERIGDKMQFSSDHQ